VIDRPVPLPALQPLPSSRGLVGVASAANFRVACAQVEPESVEYLTNTQAAS